jgi:hypothetical protein
MWIFQGGASLAGLAVAGIVLAGPAAAKPDPAPRPGHTFTLKDEFGRKANVRLVRIIDPATVRGDEGPGKGKKYIGAIFRVTEKTRRWINECADNDATMVSRGDQGFNTWIVVGTVDGYQPLGCFKLRYKGDTRIGAVVFDVPKRVGLKTITWTMSSGFAQSGTWRG